MSDGNKSISHIGSTQLQASNYIFISVSKLCQANLTSVGCFPFHFDVKNLKTQTSLACGRNKSGLREWPISPPQAHM